MIPSNWEASRSVFFSPSQHSKLDWRWNLKIVYFYAFYLFTFPFAFLSARTVPKASQCFILSFYVKWVKTLYHKLFMALLLPHADLKLSILLCFGNSPRYLCCWLRSNAIKANGFTDQPGVRASARNSAKQFSIKLFLSLHDVCRPAHQRNPRQKVFRLRNSICSSFDKGLNIFLSAFPSSPLRDEISCRQCFPSSPEESNGEKRGSENRQVINKYFGDAFSVYSTR